MADISEVLDKRYRGRHARNFDRCPIVMIR